MADQYVAPKGTVDLIGSQAHLWEHANRVAADLFGRYGYEPVYTPIFENTEVFTRGIGEATDVVGKEMYTFLDKGGRSLTLRPENTAGVVRCAINQSLTANDQSAKLYYAGPMFRYERPQKGRQRQFYQLGAEALGLSSAAVDAEMILMLKEFFLALGIPEDSMRLLVNSMGDSACRPAFRDKVAAFIVEHSGELCSECNARATTNPLRAFDCKNPKCAEVFTSAPRLADELCEDCTTHHREVLTLLDSAGVAYTADPRLVRGLDYYTRTVFEIQVDTGLGTQNAIGGGGRYDGLFEALGSRPTPGIGFAVGFERIALVLEALGAPMPGQEGIDIFIATSESSFRNTAFQIASALRGQGFSVLFDVADKSLKAQFKLADKAHARYIAILAPDEFAHNKVVFRDMATKEERLIQVDEIAQHL